MNKKIQELPVHFISDSEHPVWYRPEQSQDPVLYKICDQSYLSKFGYVVKKDSITMEELKYLKSTLIAKPLVDEKFGKPGDKDYNVYIETKNKIYIPKMFGIQRYGLPKMSKEYIGKKWAGQNESPILFKGTLLENKKNLYKTY